jgi:hypothetical protein
MTEAAGRRRLGAGASITASIEGAGNRRSQRGGRTPLARRADTGVAGLRRGAATPREVIRDRPQ